MSERQAKKSLFRRITKPFFLFITLIAVVGFIIQIAAPNYFEVSQEATQKWLKQYEPFDWIIFIGIQTLQVIITPISHYTIGLLGGFMYGAWWGGLYNYIGRMAGHICAYWLGRCFQSLIRKYVNENDFANYQRFINGTPETLWIRLLILFLMLFLPLFPDDEISYLVGLAGIPFRYYLAVLLLGHIGGSWGLSYLGAGEAKDPIFFGLVIIGFICTIGLIFFVRKLGKGTHNNANKEA